MSEDLTTDKIAEIRAKLISNRRTRIKPEDDEASKTSNLTLALNDLEVNRESRDIKSRERTWRTRSTILQSSGKVGRHKQGSCLLTNLCFLTFRSSPRRSPPS